MPGDTVAGREGPPGGWVSKSDITAFARCPYAYWLMCQGVVTREETLDPAMAAAMEHGTGFHERVDRSFPPVQVEDVGDLEALLEAGVTVFHTPVYVNWDLGLIGIPDAISPQEGSRLPVETKSHRRPRLLDEIELAFYWLLLEPEQEPGATPAGILMLASSTGPQRREVQLSPARLQQARDYIDAVRDARVHPVEPRSHDCYFCNSVRGDEVRDTLRDRKDLTLIFGLSSRTAEALETIGIASYVDLLDHEPDEVVAQLKAGTNLRRASTQLVRGWQAHARAYESNSPQWLGPPVALPETWAALDLEYISDPECPRIFLAGVTVVHGALTETTQLWANDDDTEERALLAQLGIVLRSHGNQHVVTWSGKSADVPAIGEATARLEAGNPLTELLHVDLYQEATARVRIPVTRMRLGDFSEYLGAIPAPSDITNGPQAAAAYQRSQQGTRRQAQAIESHLRTYNQNDIDALITLAGYLCLDPQT